MWVVVPMTLLKRANAKDPDFLSVDLRHTATSVVMVLRLARMLGPLTPSGDTVDRRWIGRIRTAGHRFRFEGSDLDIGTDQFLYRDGNPVRCGGQSVTFRYSDRVIKFRWPRACLGSPGWVRVGLKLAGSTTSEGWPFRMTRWSLGPRTTRMLPQLCPGGSTGVSASTVRA